MWYWAGWFFTKGQMVVYFWAVLNSLIAFFPLCYPFLLAWGDNPQEERWGPTHFVLEAHLKWPAGCLVFFHVPWKPSWFFSPFSFTSALIFCILIFSLWVFFGCLLSRWLALFCSSPQTWAPFLALLSCLTGASIAFGLGSSVTGPDCVVLVQTSGLTARHMFDTTYAGLKGRAGERLGAPLEFQGDDSIDVLPPPAFLSLLSFSDDNHLFVSLFSLSENWDYGTGSIPFQETKNPLKLPFSSMPC